MKDLSIPWRLCAFARKKIRRTKLQRRKESVEGRICAKNNFFFLGFSLLQALIDCLTHLVTKVKSIGVGGTNRADLGHENSDELLFWVDEKVGGVGTAPEILTLCRCGSIGHFWILDDGKTQSKAMAGFQV